MHRSEIPCSTTTQKNPAPSAPAIPTQKNSRLMFRVWRVAISARIRLMNFPLLINTMGNSLTAWKSPS
jgi:hypothetical protein